MENKHIYQDWLSLTQTKHTTISAACFMEVEKQYTQPNRYYHTLDHVAQLFDQIKLLKHSKTEIRLLVHVALFHDVIYDYKSTDNEFQSAQFATKWLTTLGIEMTSVDSINDMIIATATHTSDCPLTKVFLDMDLSILGATPEKYQQYCNDIRKEYQKIPLFLYKQGRKRFLKQLLSRNWIFQTKHFQVAFEDNARKNMKKELEEYSK
ncbi:hypothetical protein GCM10011344_11010 [Dokdonia pacifica]|uniref:Predicted metal-dependent phosphohydrolase, HD superfamily n=1 Tax=Dokdonia pacifica TaxID=1627892 RepID=A0A238YJQ6_9FLAO|nr:hypothetical protein [Dokdonia pacifica]GGG12134.1 hypothetical protein GCM10011344_11010 [Dokdonia pacifica]SNR70863.1 Predicted metal-dependent phosphohydrolase, HD superfamily [Dokdonia pacifica]